MKRRIDLTDVEFTRLVWVFGVALGAMSNLEPVKEILPLAVRDLGALYDRIERESVLVEDEPCH